MIPASTEEADRRDMALLADDHDSALNELMARHAEPLFHYLIRLLQNESEAADLAEETFVRIYQNRTKYKRENKFSTWLYSIATNLARDLLRYKSRHPNVSLDAERNEPGEDLKERLAEGKADPLASLERSERVTHVREALGSLPEELRVPLVLATYEEKSHVEIGEIVGCSAKAVEMRLYRARKHLRTVLEKVQGIV